MKKSFSKILSIILSICILFTMAAGIDFSAYAATNPYSGGYSNCTWYAWQRTYNKLGVALPNWGIAKNWYSNAKNAGYSVSSSAKANSIAVYGASSVNSCGHVAFVESVNGNKMKISEGGYLGAYNERTVSTTGNLDAGTKYSAKLIGFVIPQKSSNNSSPTLSLSATSVSLNLNGTNTKTIKVTAGGSLPSSYGVWYSTTEGNVSCSWGSWSGNSCNLTITGKYYGTDTITIGLYNASNDKDLVKKTVSVNVSSNLYLVYFDANGGKCNQSSKVAYYKDYYGSLPTPTREGYNFMYWVDASGNYVSQYSFVNKSYDHTLYAKWSTCPHNSKSYFIEKTATCTENGKKHWRCSTCKYEWYETIYSKGHNFTENSTVATLSQNGSIYKTCSDCDEKIVVKTIYHPTTIKLSSSKYSYDGKVKKPGVVVKDSKGNAVESSNYTVTYAGACKAVGKYAVKITFKGNYSGTKTLYFTIVPKGTTISSVASASKSMTVKWKKQAAQTAGYQIQYSTDKNFKKNNKTVTVSKNSTTSKKLTKLNGGKKYYVRIRTYKKVGSANYYSTWSKVKAVTIKK